MVWDLPLQGDPGGPTSISGTAPHQADDLLHRLLLQRSWHTGFEELREFIFKRERSSATSAISFSMNPACSTTVARNEAISWDCSS